MGGLAALWGFTGVVLLLGSAVWRLSGYLLELSIQPMHTVHWLALAVSLVFMGFFEGYRGFQQGFSPRVAARIKYLAAHPTPVRLLFAPLFCLGVFGAARRRQRITWALIVGLVLLVQLVHQLDQPWRGIVDAGVVLGLSWGLVSLVLFTAKAFTDPSFDYSPEVVDENT